MENIKRLLREAKISQSYKGYQYLLHAIRLVAENETRLCRMREDVYQKIAEMFHDNYRNVEKDIRTIRDKFWNSQGQIFLEKITGSKIDDKPYPRELIEYFVDYLKDQDQSTGEPPMPQK